MNISKWLFVVMLFGLVGRIALIGRIFLGPPHGCF